ncbi:hypothetical protein BKA67DRAFT_530446 [Truncatella angustata]|uniref:Uncharacterized protein n=1 Tax=Truncatella angustata TaxID=152316 RepID=A0A9P8UYN3_9PEZI|nr:uncharacterized protein BKA67DRAFT_530446 [Truncatella angustata]KAH6660344.1 hypothetical protein BKA67DRAFT_530446 [Truncatella angustata]
MTLAGIASLSTAVLASFNISALTSRNGYSTIQCWQLSSLPVAARSALNYDVGNTTKAIWSIIEPRTIVGEAWATTVQLTIVLNGLIHVSTLAAQELNNLSAVSADTNGYGSPPPRVEAYFQPGTLSSSVLIAADLNTTSYISGHWTEFPSNGPTVLVQTPFKDNQVPKHTVLYDGPCI